MTDETSRDRPGQVPDPLLWDLLWEVFPQSGEVRWTSTSNTMFGYDLNEAKQMPAWWMEHVHPDDAQPTREAYRRAIESGAAHYAHDYRFRKKDGTYIWLSTRGAIERDSEGRVLRIVGATLDIDRYRVTEARLQLLVEQLPALAWATDRDLRVIWALGDGSHPRALGSIGKTIPDLVAEIGGRAATVGAHRRALAGERVLYEGGREGLVLDSTVQPFRDAAGAVIGTIGVAHDVTDRKRVEEELLKVQRQLIHAARAGLVRVWEADLVADTVKSDYESLLGRKDVSELTMEQATEIIHPDDRDAVTATRLQSIETGAPFAQEYRLLVGGKERTFLSRGEVIRDASGKPVRIVGAAVDITERRQAEEDLRKTQRLLLDAEALGQVGSWEMDLLTGDVRATDENRRLFFGEGTDKGSRVEDYAEVFRPDDRPLIERTFERIAEGQDPDDAEFRIRRPDGTERIILGRTRVIRDENGKALRTFGTNADITERKHVENELARCARHHEALAQIGLRGLRGGELAELFDETVRQVVAALEVAGAVVLEALPDGTLLLRAAAGPWKEDAIGRATVPPGRIELDSAGPIPSDALALVLDSWIGCSVAAGAVAPIHGPERPFGIIGALSPTGRGWSPDDLHFLQTAASTLATAIERQRMVAELGAKREELQSLSRRLLQAQEAERRAVARELHDDLSQILTAIKLNLRRKEPTKQESIALVDAALERVRDLAQQLRPAILDELGLDASLRSYLKREAGRAGLEFRFAQGALDTRPPAQVETACFRIVQEALTNVIRHARARRFDVELMTTFDELRLVVRDDGAGFDVDAARRRSMRGESQGLLSMQERAALAGGEIDIDSAPGRGTAIRVFFPLRADRASSS